MGQRRHGILGAWAHRLLRESEGSQTLEAALFAGAVLAVSALAFSATTGSTSRALARAASVFEASGLPRGECAAAGRDGRLETGGADSELGVRLLTLPAAQPR